MGNFYFTDLEKRAIAKVLLDIVNADGVVANGEVRYFRQLQNNLDITDEHIRQAKSMGVFTAITIIRGMSQTERLSVGVMMHEMIEADGDVDMEELKVFNAVCELGNII